MTDQYIIQQLSLFPPALREKFVDQLEGAALAVEVMRGMAQPQQPEQAS